MRVGLLEARQADQVDVVAHDACAAPRAGGCRRPKAMLSQTVSHGKIPYSWKTNTRRGSGPRTGSPSISTVPASQVTKPATMLSSGRLAAARGARAGRRTRPRPRRGRCRRARRPRALPGSTKILRTPRRRTLTARLGERSSARRRGTRRPQPRCVVAPAHGPEALEAADQRVERQADDADRDHRRHDQVVALAGVARVDDQVAQARLDRDHLGRHDHQPGDAQRDAQADQDLRQGRGQDHLLDQAAARGSRSCRPSGCTSRRMLRTAAVAETTDREEGREEDQEDRALVVVPNQQDRDRDPGDRRDRAQDLDQRVEGPVQARAPAEHQAQRHGHGHGQRRSPR